MMNVRDGRQLVRGSDRRLLAGSSRSGSRWRDVAVEKRWWVEAKQVRRARE